MTNSKTSAALKQRAKQLGYPDILMTPLVRNKPLTLDVFRTTLSFATDSAESEKERLKTEWLTRLVLLFHHYDVVVDPRTVPIELLVPLLADWVPGFAIADGPKQGRGRPKKNNERTFLDVYREIETLRRNGKRAELSVACRTFKKNKGSNLSVRTIENQYRAGKKLHEELDEFLAQIKLDSKWIDRF